jgi:uncharacterized protein YjiS (DUF1127 family)
MNARTTTTRSTNAAGPLPVAAIALAWTQRVGEWLAGHARKARDREVLAQMSDRELHDIGLGRGLVDYAVSGAWQRDALR